MSLKRNILFAMGVGFLFVWGLSYGPAFAGIYKWRDAQGKWHFTDSRSKIPRVYRESIPEIKIRTETPTQLPSSALRTPLPGTIPITVSIINDGFSPVVMKIPASWKKSIKLSQDPPVYIAGLPGFKGKSQLYGAIQLGVAENKTYAFAFDRIGEQRPVLYFDRNGNGDLTDDGAPLTNKGTGRFATGIMLPFKQILPAVDLPGGYELWFFTNKSLWGKKRIAFYSRSQLKGHVIVNNKRFLVYLADIGLNDADFTNDGINIDVDGDGKIDRKREFFRPEHPVVINDVKYDFIVTWK